MLTTALTPSASSLPSSAVPHVLLHHSIGRVSSSSTDNGAHCAHQKQRWTERPLQRGQTHSIIDCHTSSHDLVSVSAYSCGCARSISLSGLARSPTLTSHLQ